MSAKSATSLDSVFAEGEISFAYLFGSRARADAHPDSDADVAVMPMRELSLSDRLRLAVRLADMLGTPDVDLVSLDRCRLEVRGRVVQEGRLIYSSCEPARVEFEVRTRSEYLDFLPTLRALKRSYVGRVATSGL